jgi:hypothetical protein
MLNFSLNTNIFGLKKFFAVKLQKKKLIICQNEKLSFIFLSLKPKICIIPNE